MPSAYLVYGLRTLADGDIPGFASTPECHQPDLRIYLGKLPFEGPLPKSSPACYDDYSAVAVFERENWWILRYDDGTDFVIDGAGTEVWVRPREGAGVEDAATYLVGPVFAFLLRLRGVFSLHASVVDIAGVAVAIAGLAGRGKSTTAATFAKLGYRVLCDDLAPLTPSGAGFHIHPGCTRVQLWPDSADLLFEALPRIVPLNGGADWWDKRYLDLAVGGRSLSQHPLPLAAVCVLEERSDDPDTPRVESLAPQAALMELVANIYGARILVGAQRAAAFETAGRLAGSTPVFRAVPHQDPARLPQLCDVIRREALAVAGCQVG